MKAVHFMTKGISCTDGTITVNQRRVGYEGYQYGTARNDSLTQRIVNQAHAVADRQSIS